MVKNILENGDLTIKMEKEKRFGLMEHNLKDNIRKVKNKDRENLLGQMDLIIKDNLKKI
jgi:hypothetical protein